jgi:hypothetical protein
MLGRLVVKSCKNIFIAAKQFLKLLFLYILVLQPDLILLALQETDPPCQVMGKPGISRHKRICAIFYGW